MEQPKDLKTNRGRPLPPEETRWKPGQSGNPRGRPKKGSIVDVLRELVETECATDPERRIYAELLMRALIHQGLKGNIGALKEISNRLVGQAPFLVERIGGVPNETDKKSSRRGNWTQDGRVRVSLERKNKILEELGLEPIDEMPD